MKINHIKFLIEASGFGCVNTNGNINPDTGESGSPYISKYGKPIQNYIFSKKRNGQMYISSNCVRGYFFKNDARGIMQGNQGGFNKNDKSGTPQHSQKEIVNLSQKMASSYLGLVRGYMLTEKDGQAIKRNSPLMVTDWLNCSDNPNLNEVMVNHLAIDEDGNKESNSLFYQDTWGDTQYNGTAILSIEQLQFIELDNRLGHQAVRFSQNPSNGNIKKDIVLFIKKLTEHLKILGKSCGMSEKTCNGIDVKYGAFTKNDTLFNYPEEGILLNSTAIHCLVLETLNRFENFSIIKAKSFVKTDSVNADFVTSINSDPLDIALEPNNVPDYQCFYTEYHADTEAQEA